MTTPLVMISRSCIGPYRNALGAPGPRTEIAGRESPLNRMPDDGRNTPANGPIAVYGATGYTGRLVAAELRRRGAEFVLAGRNAGEAGDARRGPRRPDRDPGRVARRPRGAAEAARALRRGDRLRRALRATRRAGPARPRSRPGPITSTPPASSPSCARSSTPTARTPSGRESALVTAMGFDYVPGDMIAALTAEGMGPLDEIVLAYAVAGFGATRGHGAVGPRDDRRRRRRVARRRAGVRATGRRRGQLRLSGRRSAASGWCATQPASTSPCRGTSGPDGCGRCSPPRRSIPLPLLRRVAPLAMAPLQLAVRTPLRRALAAAIPRLPGGPERGEPPQLAASRSSARLAATRAAGGER